MKYIIKPTDAISEFVQKGGGKAKNLARISQMVTQMTTHGNYLVPRWFCLSSESFVQFLKKNDLLAVIRDLQFEHRENWGPFEEKMVQLFLQSKLPEEVENELKNALRESELDGQWVSVRSSGLDEDSAENSFAGLFSSFLFQRGFDGIEQSIKRCWASGFSARAMTYRSMRGLPLTGIQIGVVIQLMVNADSAGVAFSRNPVKPLDRENLLISSVWGLGEGLVSGELDADSYTVDRKNLSFTSKIVSKSHAMRQAEEGGLLKGEVSDFGRDRSSLSEHQVKEVANLVLSLESSFLYPQDCEWAYEGDVLYVLQTRPITSLPMDSFFDAKVNGSETILWDNSNIIESYSGVTSPLTFSFASYAYRQVYIQFCEVVGVPKHVINASESIFRNMLGTLRGRVYYNLLNWYKVVLFLPGASKNKDFMDTMMGVKQKLKPEQSRAFTDLKETFHYSLFKKISIGVVTFYRFLRIDSIVLDFQTHFDQVYEEARKKKYQEMSLNELVSEYQRLDDQLLRRWHAPIINDYLCMIFFGVLKKLTSKWIMDGDSASLQNDLLCGQGDLKSTEPTKTLMRIAERIDEGDPAVRTWILNTTPAEIWKHFKAPENIDTKAPEIRKQILDFLDRYGFRCINELKLEEPDLHDDPEFIIHAIISYVKMRSYSILAMEARERAIRDKSENLVRNKIQGLRALVYFWILNQTRKAVKNRENLRFARTQIFGVIRHLFRAIGSRFEELGVLVDSKDVFYLTTDEILSYIEGRGLLVKLALIAELRKGEYEVFRKTPAPPDRLITTGAVGVSCGYSQILSESDLLRDEIPLSSDPDVLMGTPCCPGVIEGVVRVVESVQDANGINGDILVTARTDPGWVPLFPSCGGLLIERGSLLSHSAVVARELGLPTIVGISGGLMKKLKTGQRVRIDAGKGEVRILE